MSSRATSLLLFFTLVLAASAQSATHPATSELAPSFRLPGLRDTIASDSLRGRVVYVDFWASWCEPCRRSFPWLAKLQERYGSRGLAIVAIDLDQERKAGEDFLAKFPAPFHVAFDASGRTAEAFGVEAMPTSFLIGRDGKILERRAGFDAKHAAELEERIDKECGP